MLELIDVALRRGPRLLFEHAGFSLSRGDKLGLTGANGCGKSSLLSLILGELEPDAGACRIAPDWSIAHVAQETEATGRTALEHVIDGDGELRRLQQALSRAEQTRDGMAIGHLHARLEEIGAWEAESRAARLLTGLGFSQQDLQRPVSDFSGGWQMRLNLARALMCRSDLLLLDEPTNHLDLDAVIWLEQWLKQYDGALIMISHDRDFLDAVVTRIAHVEQQRLDLYRGNYSDFERLRAERLAQQQASYQQQQKAIAHMRQFIERFKAKATKARQAQSRVKALERMTLIAPAHVDSPFHFEFAEPERLPDWLMRLDRVTAGYGDQPVLENIELGLLPGQRIGLLGLNGAGKSTLIKLIAGEIEPMAGCIERARDLRIGYFAQHQLEQLDREASPLRHLQRIDPGAGEKELRSYLGGFNFSGDRVLEPVGPFSGGEKARLVLALLIWQKPNLLLLDEPTNHLDLEMRLALNQALQGFAGTVILVSHDRHLLRSVCDELLLVDQGRVLPFAMDIDDYPRWLADRRNLPQGVTRARKTGLPESQEQRKQRRQREAECRRQRQPLLNRQKRIEREMEKLEQQQQRIENRLADSDLYNDANKEELRDLIHDQALLRRQIEDMEAEWFELGERIEALQSS
jgi:ATP-binding cassette subfamily F protein 3